MFKYQLVANNDGYNVWASNEEVCVWIANYLTIKEVWNHVGFTGNNLLVDHPLEWGNINSNRFANLESQEVAF